MPFCKRLKVARHAKMQHRVGDMYDTFCTVKTTRSDCAKTAVQPRAPRDADSGAVQGSAATLQSITPLRQNGVVN